MRADDRGLRRVYMRRVKDVANGLCIMIHDFTLSAIE